MNRPSPRLRLVVLGASGATGRQLVTGALARGHEVHAVVRDPGRFDLPPDQGLVVHRGDVHDPDSIAAAVTPGSILLSGLGLRGKQDAGTLTAGARAAVAARPAHIVWLGAIGTGRSAAAVGRVVRRMLRAGFGAEYGDKTAADELVLGSGGTVVHSGPLTDRPATPHDTVPLSLVRRRFFPAFVPRAAVAQVMLDVAEAREHPGGIVVPRRS